MKKLIFLLVVMATCTQLLAQTKKYAALATDRRNYYGGDFGYVTDMPSLAEAEKKALEACKAAGGTNCRVVLSFSGAGWGAYRTYDALKGDGFGWGVAKTKKEADAMALETMQGTKMQGATPEINYYFTNTTDNSELNVIYNGNEQREDLLISNAQAIAFSKDGKKLAVGNGGGYFGGGGSIWIWELPSYKLLAKINANGYTSPIYSIAFLPDGKSLVAAEKNRVSVWDAASGKLVKSLESGFAKASCVNVSADGSLVVAAGGEKTDDAKVWQLSSGKLMQQVKGHNYGVSAVSFAPDSKTFATASIDGSVKFWEVSTGSLIRTLPADNYGHLLKGVYSPNGKLYATIDFGRSYKLNVWNVATGELVRSFPGHGTMGYTLAFYKGSQKIVSGGYNSTLKLWDLETGKEISSVGQAAFNNVEVSPDGKIGAVGSGGLQVWMINASGEFELAKLKY